MVPITLTCTRSGVDHSDFYVFKVKMSEYKQKQKQTNGPNTFTGLRVAFNAWGLDEGVVGVYTYNIMCGWIGGECLDLYVNWVLVY